MHAIQTRERTDVDGILSLRIPLGQPDVEFEVVVVVQPRPKVALEGWPSGYFHLFGSIEDETFVRPPQGELPPAVEIG